MFAWTQNRDAAAGVVRLRHRARGADVGALARACTASWPFFRALIENLEMTLAKSSLEVAREYLELVPAELDPAASSPDRGRARAHRRRPCSRSSSEDALLDRHPVLRRSIALRNPYVDPMNAIQVELLGRYRAGDEAARLPLMRSIAGIAAALRNTG